LPNNLIQRKNHVRGGDTGDHRVPPLAAVSTVAGILDRLDILKNNPDIGSPLASRIGSAPVRFKETRFLVCARHISTLPKRRAKSEIRLDIGSRFG
jgi:hypothetical protein